MRFLVAHPGASWAVHDVHTGLVAGLRAHGHDVVEYALDGRLGPSRVLLEYLWRKQVRTGGPLKDVKPTPADVQYHAGKDVVERALRHEVDWVLVVCAAYLHPDVLILCRRAGLRLAAVFTESPYKDTQQAKVAPLFDVCFTNERTSVPRLRGANPQTFYLPAAYDPAAHGRKNGGGPSPRRDSNPEPPERLSRCSTVELRGNDPPGQSVPAHDVVFIGTAVPVEGFDGRLALLSAVDWSGIDLGLYGWWEGLTEGHPLRPYVREGLVDNQKAGELYRHARIGLNLYRAAGPDQHAESLNPRAYELAADGVFTLSQPRAEVLERFGPSVPTFTRPEELQTLLRHFLRHDGPREEAAARLPSVVSEDTYHHRAAQLVKVLEGGRTPERSGPPDRGGCHAP